MLDAWIEEYSIDQNLARMRQPAVEHGIKWKSLAIKSIYLKLLWQPLVLKKMTDSQGETWRLRF